MVDACVWWMVWVWRGVRITGRIKQEAGKMHYDIHLSNTTSAVIGGFNLMVNKNVFGLQTSPLHVPDLAPVCVIRGHVWLPLHVWQHLESAC